jgi:hypothetical protein
MPDPKGSPKPAQVPGDAESPPRGEKDQTIKESVKKTDPTEPVQSGRSQGPSQRA